MAAKAGQKTEKDLKEALERIDELINAKAGTKEYEELDVLSTLVEAYENEHYPIAPPHPIDAIRFRMEQMHLKKTDLAPFMGSRAKVTEVLQGKRNLTIKMMRNLYQKLHVPAEALLS